MPSFSDFDARGYRTVDVRSGYAEWVRTYEDTVEDAMDIALPEELDDPAWSSVRRAADLGCGTGRTGAWLRDHVTAGLEAGWRLAELREGVVDERWIELKPKWEQYRGHAVSMAFAWRKPG